MNEKTSIGLIETEISVQIRSKSINVIHNSEFIVVEGGCDVCFAVSRALSTVSGFLSLQQRQHKNSIAIGYEYH